MSDDAIAEPSLILARHDLAHREHQRLHQQHHRLHRRQDATDGDATDSTEGEIVTEVIATVSVIQQIDVDANGNTFSSILVPAATEDSSPALTDSSPTTTIPSVPIPSVNNVASTAASTVADTSNSAAQLPLSLSTTSSASAPIATPSVLSSFPSLSVSSNSTALIPSSSSLSSHALSNSTSSLSSSKSSLTYIKTSSSSISFAFTSSKSTSSFYSPVSSSLLPISSTFLPTSTDAGLFGIAGGTAVATDAASTSTAATEHDSGSDSTPDTPTPVIIGSVVSSVAGAAVIILAILFIWRWRKRSRTMLSLGSGEPGGGPGAITEGPSQPSGGMTERRSLAYAVPAALASLTGYKRFSHKTDDHNTISSTAGSERGFYRVSGRKLPSVLQSGGDGYGGGIGDRIDNTLSGASFYRDSQGFYGGPGSPSFPPLGISTQRDSGVPVMRPSPARTPVTEQGPFSLEPPPLTPPARRPDGLGRSHPSQDGSHTSRFTEEV